MCSTEVVPSQWAPLIEYELATTDDSKLFEFNYVVYMLIPSRIPDGTELVANHYNNSM